MLRIDLTATAAALTHGRFSDLLSDIQQRFFDCDLSQRLRRWIYGDDEGYDDNEVFTRAAKHCTVLLIALLGGQVIPLSTARCHQLAWKPLPRRLGGVH